ncbi:MAG: DUF2891 domain-containing protein [Myxococcales bacterium]|nr:DUF2891 domain-containing protein [Myxococcales bacterium]MCB9577172.1 DUF2891 domain-containing protein [Polyangiaceae bacterium]
MNLTPTLAAELAALALGGLHREYPNRIGHLLTSDADVRAPRELTPAFFGCFDWHSAVHGHWMLARLVRLFPTEPFASEARAALDVSFTPERIHGELEYLMRDGRARFELPYGMGWLLTLGAELRRFEHDDDALRWRDVLAPLMELGFDRLARYAAELPYPVRSGEHGQSAFGLSLALDAARATGRSEMADSIARDARRLYQGDRDGPLHLEPSAFDFLSPCLGEADLMRRVLAPEAFADWLSVFLPRRGTSLTDGSFAPVRCPDPSDGRLAHLDGLNASRAWMLRGIAEGLPCGHALAAPLLDAARAHTEAALAGIHPEHYAGSHWLGTFAVYLLT